jgi:hypothetical protein
MRSKGNLQELATAYDCWIIVVTIADCAWRRDRSQPAALHPRGEQGRIYRAKEND